MKENTEIPMAHPAHPDIILPTPASENRVDIRESHRVQGRKTHARRGKPIMQLRANFA